MVRSNGSVEVLDGTGNLLGVGELDFTSHTVEYHKGDALFLYSDALIESPDANGNFIEEDELVNRIRQAYDFPARDMMGNVLAMLRQHSAGKLMDDLTLCVCKRVI